MPLRTLDDLGDIAEKRVFVRVDYNVPLQVGEVADDSRIRASLPTLTELLERRSTLVVASHLGRPKGKVDPGLTTRAPAARLGELLGRPVTWLAHPVPEMLPPDEVVMIDNLRFDPGEEEDEMFPKCRKMFSNVPGRP